MEDTPMVETPSESTIKVSVKTLDGKIYHFNVQEKLPVPQLKAIIQEATQVPVTQQRLIFQGRVLKDEHNLQFYSIKDGHVLHMVERPPDVAPAPAQPRSEPAPATAQQRPAQPAPFQQPPLRNIVLGTITIPSDAQPTGAIDLNTLVTNVLNHFGLPLGETVRFGTSVPSGSTSTSTTQASQPFSSTHRQNLCDNVTRLLDAATTSATSAQESKPTEGNRTQQQQQGRNAVETLGHHLSQLDSLTARSRPLLEQLSSLLQQESSLNELARRREAQQLASQVAPILQQLGTLMLVLSPALSTLQMGDVAGMASSQPPHSHQQILTPTDNIAIRIHNVDMPDVHVSQASSLQSSASQQPSTSAPAPSFAQRAFPVQQSRPSTSATMPTGPRPQGAPFDLGAMISSVLQAMPQASATSTTPPTATSASTTTQPPQPAQPLDFNSMMAQMLGSLGQQPPQQAQSTTSTTTAPTTPATPPNPLGALSQLLSGMGNPASGGPAMGGVLSQLLANRPPGVPQGGATGGAQSGPSMNNNPFGALMSQLLSGGMNTSTAPSTDRPAEIDLTTPGDHNAALMSSMISTITNAMNSVQSQGASSPPTVSSIIATMSQHHQQYQPDSEDHMVSDHEGALGDILHLVMDKLTVPDLIRLLQGDWTRVEPLQPAVAAYLRTQGVDSNDSEKLDQIANEIVQSLAESLDENTLPAEVKSKIVPGHNITQEALASIRRHMSKLLGLIITPLSLSINNPCPFATALRDWTRLFVGDLVGTLSSGFTGGVNDASQFVLYFLQTRLSFMDAEAASMAASLITSYVMSTYASFEQQSQESVPVRPAQPQSPPVRTPVRSPALPSSTARTGQLLQGVPPEWAEIIAADEVRQQGTQRPEGYSEAYLSGSIAQRKKQKTNTKK